MNVNIMGAYDIIQYVSLLLISLLKCNALVVPV